MSQMKESLTLSNMSQSKLTFKDKLNMEVNASLADMRNKVISEIKKQPKQTFPFLFNDIDTNIKKNNLWEKDPIDFNFKLFHPHPPKRNHQESMKPWRYDQFLRNRDEDMFKYEDIHVKRKIDFNNPEEFLYYGRELRGDKSVDQFRENDFLATFRPITPNSDRANVAKTISFRNIIGQYKNPRDHDFRGLQPLPDGLPDFKVHFEKDPNRVKFLSKHLRQIIGSAEDLELRKLDKGLQMCEKSVKKNYPSSDAKLILPKLAYPNKFYGYTRHRPQARTVESAYWDRVLPILNKKWEKEKNSLTKI